MADRKLCTDCCPELENPARIDGGLFDSDEIGPYTRWQGDLQSKLLVVGQDFADVDSFRKFMGWPGAGNNVGTNANLVELLHEAGVAVAAAGFERSDHSVFLTNAVLCMKHGGRQKQLKPQHFRNCASYLERTISIVHPRVLITLGVGALGAVVDLFDPPISKSLPAAVARHIWLTPSMCLVPMYHPSHTVVNNHRSLERMRADWRGIRPLLEPPDCAIERRTVA